MNIEIKNCNNIDNASIKIDKNKLKQSKPKRLYSAHINAMDKRLLDSPLGLAGHRCLATMFYASGEPLTRVQRESALEQTREVINADPLAHHAGATMLNDQLLVVRALASVTEPASLLLQRIWMEWRRCMWQMPATRPRIWSV